MIASYSTAGGGIEKLLKLHPTLVVRAEPWSIMLPHNCVGWLVCVHVTFSGNEMGDSGAGDAPSWLPPWDQKTVSSARME